MTKPTVTNTRSWVHALSRIDGTTLDTAATPPAKIPDPQPDAKAPAALFTPGYTPKF